MCAVFAESEVVSLLNSGCPRADVANAVLDSVAERAAGMLQRMGVNSPALFAGGGAHNHCLKDKIAALIGVDLLVPDQPQLIGAIGAACEARRLLL
jgi:activator of 2-hydroxyglutaryl-CoA dehydratase